MSKKPVALIILDGWGINESPEGNAISKASVPVFNNLLSKYPHTTLSASGMDVGLPKGQMGNSEVGHLNIGAGRIVYQELTRITKSIEDGDFFTNEGLKSAFENVKKNSSRLHLMGLLSDGGVHSHIDHVKGLIDMAKRENVSEVYLHCFLDGRDTPPKSALGYVREISDYMNSVGVGQIATVSGRYYSMDRDNRWDRTKLSYDMLVDGAGQASEDALKAIEDSYAGGVYDEFVLPTVITKGGKPLAKVESKDSVIFFNYRPDRARQLTRAIVDTEFKSFERNYVNVKYVCFTQYDISMPNVEVAYKPTAITNTLGEYISNSGLKQLRIAETEKYAHVTFFFNGGVEAPNKGEERVLVSSPNVATYDLQPEMSAKEVTDKAIEEIDKGVYDFMVLNYANPDMVGHTGVIDAAVKAVEVVDECLGRIVDKIVSLGGNVIVTADHGNAEQMIDPDTKDIFTAHTTNLVPCIIIGPYAEGKGLCGDGKLCDIAPTLLGMLGLEKPSEMEGKSLLIGN
jgi:2,3-bisphosphoglycerate-independent phosphoglycerate mutase